MTFGFLRSYEGMGRIRITPADPTKKGALAYCGQPTMTKEVLGNWRDHHANQKLDACEIDGLGFFEERISIFVAEIVKFNYPTMVNVSLLPAAGPGHDNSKAHKFVLLTVATS